MTLFIFYVAALFTSEPKHHKPADRFANEFRKYVCEQYNLAQIASGGEFMNSIHCLHFGFHKEQIVTIASGRKLIIDLGSAYLQKVNNSKNIRPFLEHYPHNVKDPSITCSFERSTDPQSDNQINCVTLSNGKIRYYLFLDNNKRELIHSETFEEAIQLAKENFDQ